MACIPIMHGSNVEAASSVQLRAGKESAELEERMAQRNDKHAGNLQNKRVVVLGGSSGIGRAVAESAAAMGAEVVIASSNPERVQKAVAAIGSGTQGHAVD